MRYRFAVLLFSKSNSHFLSLPQLMGIWMNVYVCVGASHILMENFIEMNFSEFFSFLNTRPHQWKINTLELLTGFHHLLCEKGNVSNLKEILRSMCLSFSDFKILYRNLSKRLYNGNREAETSQGTGNFLCFSWEQKVEKWSLILGRPIPHPQHECQCPLVTCSYCFLGTTALTYRETKIGLHYVFTRAMVK